MKTNQFTKQLLFCPGPVNIAENVKHASVQADICHREAEFEEIMRRLQKNILRVLEIKHPKKYAAVMVTGSGTAGNETILSSIGNKKVLVLTNGEFGERLVQIAKNHHKQVKQIAFEWGTPMNPTIIERYIKKHAVDVIVMVHHETSSGMLNPIEKIGEIAHTYGAQFIVDAVSSATVDKIDIEKNHIDFLNTTSGKAIASFPGIALIVGKKEAFEALSSIQPKIVYLNLYKFYQYSLLHQTPNTPGVQLFFALDQAIQNILSEGVEARQVRITAFANYMRDEMKKIGFNFLLNESMSSAVTSVFIPKGLTFVKIQRVLREKNIIIYNGKGPLKGKIFQVGHMGELSMDDAKYFLKCIKLVVAQPKKQTARKSTTFSRIHFPHLDLKFKLPRAIASHF